MVEERFLNYVVIDTESDPESTTTPSTMKQKNLGKILVNELHELGVSNAFMDEYGIVYAELEANCVGKDRIGFIAHMDTSSDCSGKNVKPRRVNNYDGSIIQLNETTVLDPQEFPNLLNHLNEDLIVTDGTTLLGADDKAGIAIIMSMVETLMNNPQIPHGKIGISFTCDEEVGRGADHFNVEAFDCDYAYTVDGGNIHEIAYENFNAASAYITVHGKSVHPGDAKNKMVNASLVAYEFHSLLNPFENPAYTEGYEGFNHLLEIKGVCEEATMEYIIRNHDASKLEAQKQEFIQAQQFLNQKYGYPIIDCVIEDSYKNMRQTIEKDMRCVEKAMTAMKNLNMNPVNEAIRGGTDGASLTYQGLNCPNLGTGGENFHGRFEYVSIDNMKQMVQVLLEIIKLA